MLDFEYVFLLILFLFLVTLNKYNLYILAQTNTILKGVFILLLKHIRTLM